MKGNYGCKEAKKCKNLADLDALIKELSEHDKEAQGEKSDPTELCNNGLDTSPPIDSEFQPAAAIATSKSKSNNK